jgi:hypothetical protein
VSALRKLAAVAAVLASVHSAEAMTYQYRVEKGRLVIQAAGVIQPDEGIRFLEFASDRPPPLYALFKHKGVVVFDSPGGSLGGGLYLASIISSYGMMTGVAAGGVCASGCVAV